MTKDTIRKHYLSLLNKTVNRLTTAVARTGHGPFSLIRHVGRKSGRTYETPIILGRVPEGFVAELTYGEKVNWYRNVLAADGGIVLHHCKQYRVTGIEPCEAERGRRAFPLPFRFVLTALGRREFRVLRIEGAWRTFAQESLDKRCSPTAYRTLAPARPTAPTTNPTEDESEFARSPQVHLLLEIDARVGGQDHTSAPSRKGGSCLWGVDSRRRPKAHAA